MRIENIVVLALAVLTVVPTAGLAASRSAPKLELVAEPVAYYTRVEAVAPTSAFLGPCSTIEVTYNGFTPPAEAAFQHAVDLWEQLVCSSVTIRVDATFAALPPGVLGSAGANFIHRDVFGLVPATWYPDALADAITGADLSPGHPDILANFSSTFNFYFGTDGNPAGNQYDFVTVVLHELGHGLGFFGSGRVDDGSPPAECNGTNGHGCWGFSTGGPVTFPFIWDRFVESPAGTDILVAYPNPSPALGGALTNGQVVFTGAGAVRANGALDVPLYAPGIFDQGSSYSHLDEATYPAGTPHSLMTPQLGFAEAIHDPGIVSLCLFEDIGWMTMSCNVIFVGGFESGDTSAWSTTVP